MDPLDSRAFYDRVAGVYDQRYAYHPAIGARQALWLSQMFTPGTVLDLGCGTGRMLGPLAQAGFRPVGLDCSRAMLARARRKGPSRLVLADARHGLPFASASLELVISLHATLVHFAGPGELEGLLSEAGRVLAPGGALVAELPHPATYPSETMPGAWREYQPGMSCRAAGPGLEEIRLEQEGGLCTLIRVLRIGDIEKLFRGWRRVEMHPGFRGGRFRPERGELVVVVAWK
ncbi:MAG: methyltransferase domain-containing protein [Proteobacteria bacterium]|nr:methyltransferase domain-containing protein [Pseudomonadota bacterium]MBU1450629.1 methyltransferase domain-containing protein [Pseudomonadota bacterium]MBU2518710.1 methyltransferase domain-containing protein [Pseudomonadota bacterium]